MEAQASLAQERPAIAIGQHRYDTRIAHVFRTNIDGAVTLSQLVHVSDQVVDAVVVYATPGAARLFGVGHPRELEGQYISKIHHPEDALVTRQYALARVYGEWFPAPYPMRILRGPSLEPIPVVKHVQQVVLDDVLTWITIHTPFDLASPFAMPVTQSMLDRAGSESELRLLGRMHVAYMDQTLQSMDTVPDCSLASLVEASPAYTTSSPTASPGGPQRPAPAIEELITRLTDLVSHVQVRPHHVCVKCGWPWYGRPGVTHRPSKCPHCEDKNWDRPLRLRLRDSHTSHTPRPPQ